MPKKIPSWTLAVVPLILLAGVGVWHFFQARPPIPPVVSPSTEPPLTSHATLPLPSKDGIRIDGVERVGIEPGDGSTIVAGSRTQLHLITFSSTDGSATSTDVTSYTHWSLPRESPPRATVDEYGLLTVDLKATGSLTVTANWTNGDTTFSSSTSLTITPRP